MIRIIEVTGPDDYAALKFEQQFKINEDLWKQIKNGEILTCDEDDEEYEVEASQWEDSDLKLIKHIKNRFMDYDDMKHSNFYIIDEDKNGI